MVFNGLAWLKSLTKRKDMKIKGNQQKKTKEKAHTHNGVYWIEETNDIQSCLWSLLENQKWWNECVWNWRKIRTKLLSFGECWLSILFYIAFFVEKWHPLNQITLNGDLRTLDHFLECFWFIQNDISIFEFGNKNFESSKLEQHRLILLLFTELTPVESYPNRFIFRFV